MNSILKWSLYAGLAYLSLEAGNGTPPQAQVQVGDIVAPIALDPAALSGLGLSSVKDPKQPDRKLFQTRLFRGKDLSVYVVSSESATATHKSYSLDEFLFLINGGARLEAKNRGVEDFFTSDFFAVPMGFSGVWETRGGSRYHHELSIISTKRTSKTPDPENAEPLRINQEKLSGIGLTRSSEADETYLDTAFSGLEIAVTLEAETSRNLQVKVPMEEQMIYVIAGSLSLTPVGGGVQTFHAGDFFILPSGFVGNWKSRGHHLFRSLRVRKAE